MSASDPAPWLDHDVCYSAAAEDRYWADAGIAYDVEGVAPSLPRRTSDVIKATAPLSIGWLK